MGDTNAFELFGSPQTWWLLAPHRQLIVATTPCAFISTEKKHWGASPLNWVLNLEFTLALFSVDSTLKHNENDFSIDFINT